MISGPVDRSCVICMKFCSTEICTVQCTRLNTQPNFIWLGTAVGRRLVPIWRLISNWMCKMLTASIRYHIIINNWLNAQQISTVQKCIGWMTKARCELSCAYVSCQPWQSTCWLNVCIILLLMCCNNLVWNDHVDRKTTSIYLRHHCAHKILNRQLKWVFIGQSVI